MDKALNLLVNESKQKQTKDTWLTTKGANTLTFTSAVKQGQMSLIIISLSYTKSLTELYPIHYCLITDGMKSAKQ